MIRFSACLMLSLLVQVPWLVARAEQGGQQVCIDHCNEAFAYCGFPQGALHADFKTCNNRLNVCVTECKQAYRCVQGVGCR